MHHLRDRASDRASSREDVVDLLSVLAKDVAPALQGGERQRRESLCARRCMLTSTRSATAISVMAPPLVSSSSGWTPENSAAGRKRQCEAVRWRSQRRTVEVAGKDDGGVALRSKQLLDKVAQNGRLRDALLHTAVGRRLRRAVRVRAAALGREVCASNGGEPGVRRLTGSALTPQRRTEHRRCEKSHLSRVRA